MKKITIIAMLVLILGFVLASVKRLQQPNPQILGSEAHSQSIKIGALIPLTGKFAFYGEDMRNALSLAAGEIRKSHNIDFQIVYEDSGADPKMAVPATTKLIEADKVFIVLGGPGSSANLAVAPFMEKGRVLFLVISSTPKLNLAGEYVFKMHPDIDGEVSRMVEYVFSAGHRRIGILYDSASDTNTIGQQKFKEIFEKLGGKVALSEGYDSKTVSDYKTSMAKLKNSKPDALYFLGADNAAGPAIKQAREMGINNPIFGWSAFHTPNFFSSAGQAAEGVVITDLPFSCEGNIVMKNYCLEYSQKFSKFEPTQYGAHMYDVLNILARLVKQYGNGAEGIKNHLLEIQHYQGASGDITFDEQGNVRDKNFVFRVVKEGKFEDLK